MKYLSVSGTRELQGTVRISGAKNSILPILAATLLIGGPCVLHNCPKIDDVETTLSILHDLGASVHRTGHTVTVQTAAAEGFCITPEAAGKLRSSVIFLGALLGRHGIAKLSMPGGCPLGKRPIDMHLSALSQLGAQFLVQNNRLYGRAVSRQAQTVRLPYRSVGATENVLLFSLTVSGTVTVENAAKEPEIVDLVRFLRSAGADIAGEGTDTIVIHGGTALHGTEYTVMPDRIETATYLCACAGCGGCITLQKTNAADLQPVLSVLKTSGCELNISGDLIAICSDGALKMPAHIQTAPHPAFPTDAQAVIMAAMLRAAGSGVIEETVFENRFSHAAEFLKMGADVAVSGQRATVTGVQTLQGQTLLATDLRAAAALVIAAMQADGESRIFGVRHLLRGYENPVGKLSMLGADIKTVEIPMEIVYNTV